MNSRRLLLWDARVRRRTGSVHAAWVFAVVLGILGAAALFLLRRSAGPADASAAFVVTSAGLTMIVVLGGPWRQFWRHDARVLARLPIAGTTLYVVAAWRSACLAAAVSVPSVLMAVSAASGPWDWARKTVSVLCAGICAALVAPAATSAAGALVASPRTQKALSDMTGAGGAPSIVWLSLLPAAASLLPGMLLWRLAAWTVSGGTPPPLLGIAPVAAAALFGLGFVVARSTLARAASEVAALDTVRLAHVTLERPRPLEALWGRALTSGPAHLLYRKDISLARRRHPGFFLATSAGVLAMWGSAWASAGWTVLLAAGMAGYVALLGWRLGVPPLEEPRLISTLPIPSGQVVRAKAAYLGWRAFVPISLGAAPAVARSGAPFALTMACAGISAAGFAVGVLAVNRSLKRQQGPC